MRIKSITLNNIRSYSEATIEFPEGVILLEGDIGSGKSTILYAIEFALFGLGDVRGNFLLRAHENEGFVDLKIDVNEKECRFYRSLVRRKNSIAQKECFIEYDGVRTAYTPEEMKPAVLKLLNFREPPNPRSSSVIYRYAVFTPQEEMKAILDLKPDERLQTLRKAFGIEEYRVARENTKTLVRAMDSEYDWLEGATNDLDKDLDEKNKKDEEAKKISAEIERIEKTLDIQKQKLEETKKEQTRLEALRDEKTKVDKELIGLTEKINERKTSAKELEDRMEKIKKAEQKIREISPKIELLEKKRNEQRIAEKKYEEVNGIERHLAALESSLKEKQKTIESKRNELQEMPALQERKKCIEGEIGILPELKENAQRVNNELGGIRAEIGAITKKKEEGEAEKKDYRALSGRAACPKCGQPLTEAHIEKLIQDTEKRIDEALAALEKKSEEKKRLESEMKNLNARIEKLEGFGRELGIINSNLQKLDALKNECETREKEIERLRDQKQKLEKDKTVIGITWEDIKKIKQEIDELVPFEKAYIESKSEAAKKEEVNQHLRECSAHLSALGLRLNEKKRSLEALNESFDEAQYLEIKNTYYKAVADVSGLEAKVKEKREQYALALEDQKKYDARIEEKKQQKNRMDELYRLRTWLSDFFIGALESIERHIMYAINREFEALFQKWFDMLTDFSDLTVTVDESFTPLVRQQDYDLELRALSGGERSAVALAYRLALNIMVKKVCTSMSSNLLILDEPTDGFSKEQLYHLRTLFDELNAEQIIIVSHERELEGFADTIFRLEKNGDQSKIST